MNTERPSQELQDLIEFLEEHEMRVRDFKWYIIDEDLKDVNYIRSLNGICYSSTLDYPSLGIKNMDIVMLKSITEGSLEKAWPVVSKDSGSLAIYADPKLYDFSKLNTLVSCIIPYKDVGMVVDISKNGYTGMLVRKTN